MEEGSFETLPPVRMPDATPSNPRRLAAILAAVMLFALFMGPGPGIYLVNPDPADPEAIRFVFGMPILWVWAVFWFLVEAACVAVAYTLLWRGKRS